MAFCPIVFHVPDEDTCANKEIIDLKPKKFNVEYFTKGNHPIKIDPPDEQTDTAIEVVDKPKKARKPKETAVVVQQKNDLQYQDNTNIPYASSYSETNSILRSASLQADVLLHEIKEDIDTIRSSKTIKNKYTYLTNLSSSAANLISTRITAARELNNSITQAHNLELKRAKDIKDASTENKNDDARMMDLYNAFIRAPYGMYNNGLNMPTIQDMTLGTNDANSPVTGVSMQMAHDDTNLSPEQIRMRNENNPNIEEVVKYDPASGRRWFEVIDNTTGNPIPNYPTSDPFLLEDISIDARAGIARNRNLDRVWTLVTIDNVSEY